MRAPGWVWLFFGQLANYFLLCVSYRAVAHANYAQIVIFDFAIATFGYFVLRKIISSPATVGSWLAYAVGGVLGSLLGTWTSATFLGVS